ncbi:MAG: transposase [Dehalococcoidia bacterium]|nr:transposase [Dehalococcoidia bacterium]
MSKLRVARAVGKRDQRLLAKLLQQVARRVEGRPRFSSDQLPGYEEAIVDVFGVVPPYGGRGRPPTKKRPSPGLDYGQVVKERVRGRVVAVTTRIVFGDDGPVTTSGVERTHLTSRQRNGRLVRKTLSFSKKRERLAWACAWEDLIYNFAQPIKTLRVKAPERPLCWRLRTPAMAARLTDHVWSLEELLTMRLPKQGNQHRQL